jgi:hypothetical protein
MWIVRLAFGIPTFEVRVDGSVFCRYQHFGASRDRKRQRSEYKFFYRACVAASSSQESQGRSLRRESLCVRLQAKRSCSSDRFLW